MPHEKAEVPVEVLVPPPPMGDARKSIKFKHSKEAQDAQNISEQKPEVDPRKSQNVSKPDGHKDLKSGKEGGAHHRSKKARKKEEEEQNLSKARRLKRVMKPLVQKCIPDNNRPAKKELTEAEAKRAAATKHFKRKGLREDEMRRRSSNICFVLPKLRDPEEIQKLKTEKMVHKLIKYMKKSWKVKVDPRQEDRELVYRTINTVTTKKPANWRSLLEEREQVAVETGFFCGFDGPYAPLINLELDTPMLVFNNLAPDLKITAVKWLRDKALKEELKKKRDANLPRLPRNKIKRPSFARGRILQDPGGVREIDNFVQVAEVFQKLTGGNASYAKVLSEYVQKKEEANENINSGFGIIRGDLKYGFKASSAPDEVAVGEDVDYNATAEAKSGTSRSDRRDSVADGRKYQRQMLTMEYMISALFDIIKSLLNITRKQLMAYLPMPSEVVMQLRTESPRNKGRRGKVAPPISVLKRVKRNPGVYTNVGTLANTVVPSVVMSTLNSSEASDEDCIDDDDEEERFLVDVKSKQAGDTASLRDKLSVPSKLGVNDIITLSPVRSSAQVIAGIKKVHSQNERQLAQKHNNLSAEQKIRQLTETAEHAAIRIARNAATYAKLFDRHKKLKPPIWHNVEVSHFSSAMPGKKPTKDHKDPSNLTEADAEEMVDLAIRKRQTMQSNKRWPNESQILTPVFPFDPSATKINSEEQSRRNLLAKTANIDEVPPTPVRRLYKLAGVRTTDKQTFNTLLDMKKAFRSTEKKVRIFYQNEIGTMDWDTMKRFRCKVNGIMPDPVFQWTIAIMRQAMKYSIDGEEDDTMRTEEGEGVKRQALWYRKLVEECTQLGATRHNGCQDALSRLMKFCDVDLKTRPRMLERLALLVVSLPTTELGSRHWQQAVLFLLENLFGAQPEMLYQWLSYRGLPFLL